MNVTNITFDDVRSVSLIKTVCIVFSWTSAGILILLFYGIIWYERFGSDNNRTLINKLVSSVCWTIIEWFVFGQLPDSFIYVAKRLPKEFCFLHLLLKRSCSSQILILFDVMIVIRFLMIFKLKNPAAIKDDFWIIYLNIWVVMMSTFYQLTILLLPGKLPLTYSLCSDTDPLEEHLKPKKVGGALEILSLVIHVTVWIRIILYRRKTRIHPQSKTVFEKSTLLNEIESGSLSSMMSNCLNVTTLAIGALLTGFVGSFHPEQLTKYPYYILLYVLSLIGPSIMAILTVTTYYASHKKLRKTISAETFKRLHSPISR